nr:uncharacterized protein LOC109154902 [Ipomoea trifida]
MGVKNRMGSKKKNTGRHPVNKVASNISAPARNLPENDLGGVIFGCKDHTIREWNSWTSEEWASRHNIQPLLEIP